MTDTTPLDVAAARQRLDEALAAEHEAQDALLINIANGLGEHAEQRARALTREQPERAHALGKEGIARLRSELAGVANGLADELARSRAQIDWPKQRSSLGRVGLNDIQKAISEFLYGHRVDQLSEVLNQCGFKASTSASGAAAITSITHPFLPQFLYSEKDLRADFEAVSKAAANVLSARDLLQLAEKEQSKASVDDLWN